jgi:hypothetical protein
MSKLCYILAAAALWANSTAASVVVIEPKQMGLGHYEFGPSAGGAWYVDGYDTRNYVAFDTSSLVGFDIVTASIEITGASYVRLPSTSPAETLTFTLHQVNRPVSDYIPRYDIEDSDRSNYYIDRWASLGSGPIVGSTQLSFAAAKAQEFTAPMPDIVIPVLNKSSLLSFIGGTWFLGGVMSVESYDTYAFFGPPTVRLVVQVVPLPAAAWMLGIGLMGLAGVKLRSRWQHAAP